jgi:GNAT superfamily N-acetyltransferase
MSEIMCVDSTELTVRPIEIGDAERLERMFGRLSRESIYYRFFSPIPRLSRSALVRLVDVDHCHRDALVALDGDEIVAEVRYGALAAGPSEAPDEAEIAVIVEDAWQRRGLGTRLTARLATLARERGYARFIATILGENRAALRLVRKLSPDATFSFAHGEYEARLPLTAVSGQASSDGR